MTDRELLELAAKAAGIKIDKSPYGGGGIGNDGFDAAGNAVTDWHNGKKWNPLADDGDSRRLQVRLNILMEFGDNYVCAYAGGRCETQFTSSFRVPVCATAGLVDAMRESAARQSVLMAAAEMGRRMK